jgi:hypothetical protein
MFPLINYQLHQFRFTNLLYTIIVPLLIPHSALCVFIWVGNTVRLLLSIMEQREAFFLLFHLFF